MRSQLAPVLPKVAGNDTEAKAKVPAASAARPAAGDRQQADKRATAEPRRSWQTACCRCCGGRAKSRCTRCQRRRRRRRQRNIAGKTSSRRPAGGKSHRDAMFATSPPVRDRAARCENPPVDERRSRVKGDAFLRRGSISITLRAITGSDKMLQESIHELRGRGANLRYNINLVLSPD